MKKSILVSLLALTSFSCQKETPEVKTSTLTITELEQISNDFETKFSSTLNYVATNSPLISIYSISADSVDVEIDVENIDDLAQDFLSRHFFKDTDIVLDDVELEKAFDFPDIEEATMPSIIELTTVYSENQKVLLLPFSEQIMSLDDIADGIDIICDFNTEVMTSAILSDAEKIQLLEYSAGLKALNEFFTLGGVDDIYSTMFLTSSVAGRIQECSIDMRSVWAGAVVGLSIGAVRGGIAGFITGSFTVPVLGTAVGTVGGAVFGGAAGFVEGAIAATIGSLLLTCGRATPKYRGYASASCKKMAKMGLQLPSVCFRNIRYRMHKNEFKTRLKLIIER